MIKDNINRIIAIVIGLLLTTLIIYICFLRNRVAFEKFDIKFCDIKSIEVSVLSCYDSAHTTHWADYSNISKLLSDLKYEGTTKYGLYGVGYTFCISTYDNKLVAVALSKSDHIQVNYIENYTPDMNLPNEIDYTIYSIPEDDFVALHNLLTDIDARHSAA